MLDAAFWLELATEYRQEAETTRDGEAREELRVLAEICRVVAYRIEEHTPGG
jgi:hypothetical protein